MSPVVAGHGSNPEAKEEELRADMVLLGLCHVASLRLMNKDWTGVDRQDNALSQT